MRKVRQTESTDETVEVQIQRGQVPTVVHGKSSGGNGSAGELDHVRGKIDSEQVEVWPLRHEEAGDIAGPQAASNTRARPGEATHKIRGKYERTWSAPYIYRDRYPRICQKYRLTMLNDP